MTSRRTFLLGAGAAGAIPAAQTLSGSPADRIRLGIIGAGARGLELMRDALGSPNVEFAAIADVYSRRHAEAARLAPHARRLFDYRELLDDTTIDAVVIATPPHLHCEHFVDSLAAGKHVYQEKTMAFTVEHAKRMREAFLRSGRLVQIGTQGCSAGVVTDAQKMLAEGLVGRITEIHGHMYRNTPHNKPQWARPIPPDAVPDNIRWKAFLGGAPQIDFDANRFINWRFFWDYSGGNVFENMVHQLAVWYKVLNLRIPSKVTMTGGVFLWKDGRQVPDTMCVSMEHSEGLLFNWTSGFGNVRLGEAETVMGTDGTLVHDWKRVRYLPEKVNRPDGSERSGETPDENHMTNFLRNLREGRQPSAPFELGFRTAITCRMAVESFRQGRTMRWDPDREAVI